MQRVSRGLLKTKLDVKISSLFIRGMYQQGTDTGYLCCLPGPYHGVAKQKPSQPFPLAPDIHGQPSQKNRGNRFRHVSSNSGRGLLPFNGRNGQGVIRQDAIVNGADERPRSSPPFVSLGAIHQPLVEKRVSTIE